MLKRTLVALVVVVLVAGIVQPSGVSAATCTLWFTCPPPPPATAGLFEPSALFGGGTAPWMLEKGDINGDHKTDIVATNWLGGEYSSVEDAGLAYYLNTTPPGGPVSFDGPHFLDIGYWGQDVRLADLSGTGKLDIIATNAILSGDQGFGDISVFRNLTPAGSFLPVLAQRQTFSAGRVPETLTVADVNGDNKLDLATANYLGVPGADGVSVLLSTSSGPGDVSFTPPQHFSAAAPIAQGIVFGDLDGDKKPEIVVADSTYIFGNTVAVLKNTTPTGSLTASFGAPQVLSAGLGPSYVSIADMNNDGRMDLSVSNLYDFIDYGVSVFMNTTPPGASQPTFTRKYQVRADFAQPALHAHWDVNGDGKRDLLTSNWGNHAGYGVNLDGRGYGASVMLNRTPNGSLTPKFDAPIQLETPTGTWDVSHADFDGDGIQDIAVTITNTSPYLSSFPVPGNCTEPCGLMVFVNHVPQQGVALPPFEDSWLTSDYYCPLIYPH